VLRELRLEHRETVQPLSAMGVEELRGADLLALKGAENSLKFFDSLLIEVSKVDIYENGFLWPELKDWLMKRNFYPIT
jgi:hypothetical protein